MNFLHVSLTSISGRDLDQQDLNDQVVLEDLLGLCRLLRNRTAPLQMDFSLSGNIADVETAEKVSITVMNLPKLRDCAISLHRYRNKTFSRIARTAAVNLMDIPAVDTGASFPFDCLPKELRILILSYTGLVARTQATMKYGDRLTFKLEPGYSYLWGTCCGNFTGSAKDCCCPARSAAFSKGCLCLQMPSPLLLVSQRMHDESCEVFFSQIRLVFSGDFAGTLRMLAQMPAYGLKHIRMIDLVIVKEVEAWIDFDQSWKNLVNFIGDNMDLPKLWLTITAGVYRKRSEEENLTARAAYRAFIEPLRQLRGLRRFHVWLSWDFDYEVVAEKEVMGETYDSSKDGKTWPRCYETWFIPKLDRWSCRI